MLLNSSRRTFSSLNQAIRKEREGQSNAGYCTTSNRGKFIIQDASKRYKRGDCVNEWLILSLGLFGIWFILFITRPTLRRELIWVSILTMPLGLTEPLFVPEYWNPPSLFNLAARTGFDIESLIFSFALGGVAAVFYEAVTKKRHRRVFEPHGKSVHWIAIAFPLLVFLPLYFFTALNPIYSVIISAALGAIAVIACRQDLAKQILMGGVCFATLYFSSFLLINLAFPKFVTYWNLRMLSGVLILDPRGSSWQKGEVIRPSQKLDSGLRLGSPLLMRKEEIENIVRSGYADVYAALNRS